MRQIDSAEFAHLAHPLYKEAATSYGVSPPTEAEYVEAISRWSAYPGTEYWGAFRREGLAAFAICQIVDGAVDLASAKSYPHLNRYNPNAALFYSLTRHYLSQGMRYVTNGSRTLWHPTGINDFLGTLGYRRVCCRVNIELSSSLNIAVRTRLLSFAKHLPLGAIFGARWRQLQGLERLVAISRSFHDS